MTFAVRRAICRVFMIFATFTAPAQMTAAPLLLACRPSGFPLGVPSIAVVTVLVAAAEVTVFAAPHLFGNTPVLRVSVTMKRFTTGFTKNMMVHVVYEAVYVVCCVVYEAVPVVFFVVFSVVRGY
jgi:hypothetical protein